MDQTPWTHKQNRDNSFVKVLKDNGVPKDEADKLYLSANIELKKQMQDTLMVQVIQSSHDEDKKSNDEERRLLLLERVETFKKDVLKLDTNRNALFSCDGNHYIKFKKGVMETKEGEVKSNFNQTSSKLMDLSFKSSVPTEFEVFMTDYITERYGIPPSRNDIQSVVVQLMKCTFENPQIMVNRCAFKSNTIYYDIGDEENNIVIINKDGWNVVEDTEEIIFRREDHFKAQVLPIRGGDVMKIFKYLHVTDEDEKKLVLVYLITCFLADIDKVILQIHGNTGCGKSVFNRFINLIVDPTNSEYGKDLNSKVDIKEIEKFALHRYVTQFDNAVTISKEISNLICRFSTGYSSTEKQLYTNYNEVGRTFKTLVVISGVEPVGTETDFLDRTINIGLDIIKGRTGPVELMASFEKDKPEILGGIFDVHHKALGIIEQVNPKIPDAIRMVEFAKWGYAIAEALDIGGEEFIRIYMNKITEKDKEAVENNPVGNVLLQYMEELPTDKLIGTAKQLLERMDKFMTNREIVVDDWPTVPRTFSSKLNKVTTNLMTLGIECNKKTTNGNKFITVKNHNFDNNKNASIVNNESIVVSQSVKIPAIAR